MKPIRRRASFVLILVLALSIGATGGFLWPRAADGDDFFALRKNFEIFGAVYEELVTGYVDEVDPERLMRDGVDAMLDDLDPYTTFIDEAESTDLRIITRGRYGGVGLSVARRDEKITVTAPIEGTSGYKQGVRAGDVITQIDGTPAANLSLEDVRTMLRGEPGTAVEITVEREGAPAPIEFLLTRQQVQLKNVTYRGFLGGPESTIGYLKLERFTRTAGAEVRAGLEALRREGHLGGLVLDLRDNPGGLLSAAVEVSQLFVPEGSVIVSTRGRTSESRRAYRSQEPPIAPKVPLVVLVNEFSASASEIVAGAVQDLDRGVVLGQTTFGKGLVQVIRELPYNTALKMTTAKYYTPSGRSIQSVEYGEADSTARAEEAARPYRTAAGRPVSGGRGIEPDVVVIEKDSPLEEALQRRAAFFFYANHYAATHPDDVDTSFAVTDATVADFRAWLDAENVAYRTDAERAVDRLAAALAKDGFADAGDEAAALQAAVHAEVDEGFAEHAADLKEHLRAEILARFAGEGAQIRAALKNDPQARHAASLLRDSDEYAAILTGE